MSTDTSKILRFVPPTSVLEVELLTHEKNSIAYVLYRMDQQVPERGQLAAIVNKYVTWKSKPTGMSQQCINGLLCAQGFQAPDRGCSSIYANYYQSIQLNTYP